MDLLWLTLGEAVALVVVLYAMWRRDHRSPFTPHQPKENRHARVPR